MGDSAVLDDLADVASYDRSKALFDSLRVVTGASSFVSEFFARLDRRRDGVVTLLSLDVDPSSVLAVEDDLRLDTEEERAFELLRPRGRPLGLFPLVGLSARLELRLPRLGLRPRVDVESSPLRPVYTI